MSTSGRGLPPEKYEWLQRKLKEFTLSPEAWISTLMSYGISADCLTGNASSCPVCGGDDRFTYDNKSGRGDWICRKCNDGYPMAGDGLQLIARANRMALYRLMCELDGGSPPTSRAPLNSTAPAPRRKADPAFVARRLDAMWSSAQPQAVGDLSMRYLQDRVPGLTAGPSPALRLGLLEYRHDKKVLGEWPGIVARFELPDGCLGTLHRTFLDPVKPAKATIVSRDGEILDAKLNDMTLNPLAGGAVRLMSPIDGEIGVGEGLETVYGAHMEFGVPVWNCLNRILLSKFVVPEGLGIKVVHIFMDFDDIDPRTRQSPGVSAGLVLAKRLRAEGYTVVPHRPKLRGTDFADQWKSRWIAAHGTAPLGRPASHASRVALAI
ncbi:primase-helicase zinc-binding domain-containing protein [Paraburkholderia sp. CNPSo 3281]|uniref:primase-helicase zinc-binding domain-containing protein n=1 Tax=Paraburkholderia sp. CNPSo 3281 TaxID=2940933 RepID=UPI0020B6D07C|nr:primase-helicase zinc-binding domain-containing protein [Paraburkholderia sp. CNPSo 3281]MCP3718500.1 zinc-binding protein [Paraburkholderia sp. CNPSo 3281]